MEQRIHSRSHLRRQVLIGNGRDGQMAEMIPRQHTRGQADEEEKFEQYVFHTLFGAEDAAASQGGVF